jgi:hypothetical protein
MATVNEVKIVISVDGSAAQGGIDKASSSLQQLGQSGRVAGAQVGAGMQQISSHSLTALDNVRLLRDDLGIRIPRSMEKAIASSQMLMGVIKGMGTGLLALGAIDIGVRIGQSLYNAYEKWISLSAAAQAYQDQVQKTKDEDFIKVETIETATARIHEATAAARDFKSTAESMQGGFWKDILSGAASGGAAGAFSAAMQDTWGARQMADAGYKRQSQTDALSPDRLKLQHQQRVDQIEVQHAGDARLRSEQKITAEKEKQRSINNENRDYDVAQEKLRGNTVPANAGFAHRDALNAIADQKAAAESANLQREQASEMQRMHAEANEAQLHGPALYRQQESDAIDALKFKDIDRAQATDQIQKKFHGEQMKRLQDEDNELQKMHGETLAAGLTGVARIQQEGRNRVNDVWGNPNSNMDPGQRLSAIHEISQQTKQQTEQSVREFTDRVNSLGDETTGRGQQGFARIEADRRKQLDTWQKNYSTEFGSDSSHNSDLQRAQGYVNSGADQQRAELARKNAEETSQIEAEARTKSLSADKQQTAAIQTEYEERVQKYGQQLQEQEILQQDYDRRVVAAAQMRDAQMEESARQSREKMSGEFSSFFKSLDHPTQALAEAGSKVGGEVAAALVQRVQNHFGSGNSQGSTMDSLTHPQVILDRIAGRPHGTNVNPLPSATAQTAPGVPWSGAHGTTSTSHPAYTGMPSVGTQAISLGSAQISIGSASIAFGGASNGTTRGSGGSGEAIYSGAAPSSYIGSSTSFSGGDGSFVSGDRSGGGSINVPTASGTGGYASSSASAQGFSGGAIYSSAPSSYSAGSLPSFSGGGASSASGGGFSGGGGYSGGDGGFSGGGSASVSGTSGAMGGGTIGGAGSSSVAGPSTASFERGSGAAGSTHSAVAQVGSDIQGGMALYQKGAQIFGGGTASAAGVSSAANQTLDTQGSGLADDVQIGGATNNGSMLGVGGLSMSNAAGAVGGAMGLYSAVEGNGGIGGTLNGAMSGMQLGMSVGGPIGAAIGAVGGAVLGALGLGGREKARVYWLKQAQPRVQGDIDSFEQGGMDYMSAYQDIESAQADADRATNAMGPAGKSYFQDTIKPAIAQLEGKLTSEQRAGRADFTDSAAQYAIGTDSVPRDGLSIIHRNERIMPSDQNERITRAVESVGDSTRMPPASGFGGDVHLHVHAIDASGVQKFLNDNKHGIRSAVNASYAENSGGADFYA